MLNFELVFSLAGLFAMAGWITLLTSPLIPVWSQRIAGILVPSLLSGLYVALILFFSSGGDGGFGSLAEVTKLFSREDAVLAGWVHYLAFDLLIGAWICRTARRESIHFWFAVPCLPLTFMFGPAGYLAFNLVRIISKKKQDMGSE
jgi:hypothetical protein